MAGRARRLRVAFEANALLIAAIAVCAGLQASLIRTEIKPDTWLGLVAGRLIAHHGLPHHDTLNAITAGRGWVDQQWLAHLSLYGLWAAGGWPLALLAGVALFAGSFAVLAGSARRRGASERSTALVVVSLLPGGALGWRPSRADRGIPAVRVRAGAPSLRRTAPVAASLARRPAARPLGEHPRVGGARGVACGAVGARRRRAGGECRLLERSGSSSSPGRVCSHRRTRFQLPGYYRSVLWNPELARASSEWASPTLRGFPLFFALLGVSIVLTLLGRRRMSPFGFLALLGTAALGLLAVRNDVWFALAAAAVLPTALDAVWAPSASRRRVGVNLALMLAAVAFAAALAAVGSSRSEASFAHPLDPAAAEAVAAAARSHPGALVFANEMYADWLVLEQPSLAGRVAYDIRYELLHPSELARIVAFRRERGPSWLQAVNRYQLLVLGTADDRGAIARLKERAGARVVYRDPEITVLDQRSAS